MRLSSTEAERRVRDGVYSDKPSCYFYRAMGPLKKQQQKTKRKDGCFELLLYCYRAMGPLMKRKKKRKSKAVVLNAIVSFILSESEYYELSAVQRIAQLIERQTEKPGAILTCVRAPRCGKGFFSQSQLSVQTLLRCLYSPPCAIAGISICAHVKNPQHWQPYHCLGTRQYCTHR